jgi:acetyl-CoA carboxylase carboxyltransferase component
MNETNMEKKISELMRKKEEATRGGGSDKIAIQHKLGKLTARERISKLLDKDTFREYDQFVHHRCSDFGMQNIRAPGDGVITGQGKINGQKVFVFAQDYTFLAGTLGEFHAAKIAKIMDLAAMVGVPVIGMNDSGGGRIQEGADAQKGYGSIFYRNAIYSGVIPQISLILGPCAGGAVYSPAMTDFIYMCEPISYMFLTGPKVIKEVTGEDISVHELGGSSVHSKKSGVAHFCLRTEEECFDHLRRLLSFIPPNNRERPPVRECDDSPYRDSGKISGIIPGEMRKSYDVRGVIEDLTDRLEFLEIHKSWAENIVVGFGRVGGYSIGIVANQPRVLAGSIDINASDKAARFIRFCNAFNIPLLTLVDTPAFLPGKYQEFAGIIRHGAKLLYAYSEATVPKITVILRKAYGGGYVAMCHKELGADRVFALPTAEIAMMGAEGAAELIFRKEIAGAEDAEKMRQKKIDEFRSHFGNPYVAASRGYIDEIIKPSEARRAVFESLEFLLGKQDKRPNKKIGNIPL